VNYDYSKMVLERVSFDSKLFEKNLKKAIKTLLPYEVKYFKNCLFFFTDEKSELKGYL
jgi:hypothetical protein